MLLDLNFVPNYLVAGAMVKTMLNSKKVVQSGEFVSWYVRSGIIWYVVWVVLYVANMNKFNA